MPRMSARATAVFLAGIALLWVLLPRLRPATDDITAVRQAEAQLDLASAKGEIGVLGGLIASDFSTVDGDGRRETRSDLLHRLRANAWRVQSLRQENLQIHFYGSMAIVTGADRIRTRDAAGRDRSGAYPFLHVFQKRHGRWLLVSGMGSPAAIP